MNGGQTETPKQKRNWLRSFFDSVPQRFPSVESALGLTLTLLLLTIIGYIFIHDRFPGESPSWSDAVRWSSVQLFEPEFCQSVLERYIAPSELTEFKQSVKSRCDEIAQIAVQQRRSLMADVISFTSQAMAQKRFPQAWRADNGEVPVENLRQVPLEEVRRWLSENTQQGVDSSRRVEVQGLLQSLEAQMARESELRSSLTHEIGCLQPVVAFDWLYIDNFGWVFELFAWCWVGVLGNTIIKLVEAMRKDTYKAREFCLLFPKAILAPVLAMVITALWASGLSESKINFANLPYLLVLFFLLGFATENLYGKIAGLADLIVTPSATLSQAKLEAAGAADRYKFTTRLTAVESHPKPANLQQLEAKLRAVTGSLAERGVVAKLSKEDQ